MVKGLDDPAEDWWTDKMKFSSTLLQARRRGDKWPFVVGDGVGVRRAVGADYGGEVSQGPRREPRVRRRRPPGPGRVTPTRGEVPRGGDPGRLGHPWASLIH